MSTPNEDASEEELRTIIKLVDSVKLSRVQARFVRAWAYGEEPTSAISLIEWLSWLAQH